MGVTGAARPMNDLRRPSPLNVATRGVDSVGKGNEFDVSVSVDGVRVVARVGDGGKTNSVCEGVASGAAGLVFGGVDLRERRRCAGGVDGLRDSVRGRVWLAEELTGMMGDAGTAGKIPSGGGRRRGFAVRLARGVKSKEDLIAVAGTGGSVNEDL